MAARKNAPGNNSDGPGLETAHGLDEVADSSRRDLLSILGTGVGALALAACTTDVGEQGGSGERVATTQQSFTLTDINAAIANAGAGGVAVLQPGTYNITSEILLENSTSLVCNGGRAKIVWDGGMSQASMLVIKNSTHSEIRNLDFDVGTGSKPLAALKLLDGANHSITFRSVRVGHAIAASADFQFGVLTKNTTALNDYMLFESCFFRNCETTVLIENGQNTDWRFINCTFYNATEYAIRCYSNLSMANCFFASNGVDFLFEGITNVKSVSLVNVRSERSGTWIKCNGHLMLRGEACGFSVWTANRLLELTGNAHQRVEMNNVELFDGDSLDTTSVRCVPDPGGSSDKTVILRGRTNIDIDVDLDPAGSYHELDRRRIVLDFKRDDSTDTKILIDTVNTRQELLPGDGADYVQDLEADRVRMGFRRANGTGSTEVVTKLITHNFIGSGDATNRYLIPDAFPAGALILGVTARRDYGIVLPHTGYISVNIGDGNNPTRWGSEVLKGNGTREDQRTTSADFLDGSPLFAAQGTELWVQGWDHVNNAPLHLDSGRIHFTIHYIELMGGPDPGPPPP